MTLSIDQAVCNSFKSQLLDADHDFDLVQDKFLN
jgi:hypothetical protein